MTTEPAVEQTTTSPLHSIKSHESRERIFHDHWELIVLLSVGLIGAFAALLGAPLALRTVFGLPLIIFVPGYALVSALFPTNEGLDGLERVALGFGLSLALIPLIALGIEFSPWRFTLAPIVGSLVSCAVLFTVIAILRRSRAPTAERFIADIPTPRVPPVTSWSGTTRAGLGIFIVALLVFGGSSAALVAQRLRTEPSTEFAIHNATGQAEFFPRDFTPGQPQTLEFEIDNHEGKRVDYRIEIMAGKTTVGSIDSISVASGDTWRKSASVAIPRTTEVATDGRSIPLVFNLYRGDRSAASTPYRSLRLFVNIDTGTPAP